VDLEAVTPVPGQTDTYLALASAGDVLQVRVILKENRVEVINNFRLPDIKPDDNYEGIALYNAGGKMLAAWGHRGDGASPGAIHWGIADLSNGTITNTSSVNFTVPWPEGANVRHISDVVIDEKGNLYVAAALDLGDDGPFSSVIYKAGTFAVAEAGVTFQKLDTLVKIYQANGYKMEGIVLLPGGTSSFAAGSDDENAGSFLRIIK
jgi:hypothetical protein